MRHQKPSTRIISAILTLAMLCGLVPTTVFAAQEDAVEVAEDVAPKSIAATIANPMIEEQSGAQDIAVEQEPRTREKLLTLDGVNLTEDGQVASIKASVLQTLSAEEREILLDKPERGAFSNQPADYNAEIREQFGLTNEQIEKGINLHGDRLAFTHELSDLRVNCDNMTISDIQKEEIARLIASGYACSQAILAYAAMNTFALELSHLESSKQAEIELLMATDEDSPDGAQEADVEDYLASKTGLPKSLVTQIIASGEVSAYQMEQEMDGALARTFPCLDAVQSDEYETAKLAATEDSQIRYSPKEVLGKLYSYEKRGNFEINLSTGAYSYTETDLSIPGKNGLDLVLTRQFHSEQASTRTAMGALSPTQGYRYDISDKPAFNVYCRWCVVDTANNNKIIGELTDRDGYTFSDDTLAIYAKDSRSFLISHYSKESLEEEYRINPPPTTEEEEDMTTALEYKAFLESQVGGYILRAKNAKGQTYFLTLVPTITGVADIMEKYTESFSQENSYLVDEFGLGHGWMLGFSHFRREYPGYGDINTDDLQLRLTTSDGTQYFIEKYVGTSGNYIENYKGNDIMFHKCVSGEYPGAFYGLYHKDGKVEYFDANGRNIAIVDRFGNKITLSYTFADAQKTLVTKIQITDTINNSVTYEKIELGPNETYEIGTKNCNGLWRLSLNGQIIREYYTYTQPWTLRRTPNPDGSFSELKTFPVELIGVKNEVGEMTRYDTEPRQSRFNCFLQPAKRAYAENTALFSSDGFDLIINLKKATYSNGARSEILVTHPIETFGLNGYRHYSRCNNVVPLSSSDRASSTAKYTWGDFDYLEGQCVANAGTYYTTVINQQVYPFKNSDGTPLKTGLLWTNNEQRYAFNSWGQVKEYTKESHDAMPFAQDFAPENYAWGDIQKAKTEAVQYSYNSEYDREPSQVATIYYDKVGEAGMTATHTYTYDNKWNITSHTKPNGSKETYTYDAAYNLPLTQTIQQDSSTTIKVTNTLTADKKNISVSNVTRGTTAVGKTTFSYNIAGQLTAQNDYLSASTFVTTAYGYGSGALPTSVSVSGVETASGTTAAGSPGFTAGTVARKQTYNDRGWITSETDAKGKTTNYQYDAVGRIAKVTYPDSSTQTYTYDVPNNTVTYTDEAGSSWLCTYGNSGKLLTVKDLTSNKVLESYTYDHLDRLVKKVTHGDATPSQITYYRYDTDGRLIEQRNVNASGYDLYQECYSYEYIDGFAMVRKSTGGNGYAPSVVTTSYQDNMGNVVKTGRFLKDTEYFDTFVYDYLGNQIETKSAYNTSLNDAYSTKTTYDYAGRPLTITNILGQKTTKTYDWMGNLLTDTDPKGNVTRYTYDALGRLVRVAAPLDSGRTSQTDYTYDPNGNIIEERTRTGSAATSTTARVTAYEYDDMGRVIQVKGNGKEDGKSGTNQFQYTQYVYDKLGNVTKMYTGLHAPLTISSSGSVSSGGDTSYSVTRYDYDRYSRLVKQTDPLGKSETYTYDLNGNLTVKKDRRGVTTRNTFDAMGRITRSEAGTDYLQFSYTPTNRLWEAKTYGKTTTYSYDALGRLISEKTPYATKTFTYNIGDLRTNFKVADDTATYLNNTYTYDKLGRLKTVNGSGAQATYAYDANGNLSSTTYNNNTTATYTYNSGNLPTQVQNKKSSTVLSRYNYTYGLDGNQLSKSDNLGRTTTYVYDGLNRLIKETQTGSGAFTNSYTYDDYSNRVTATLAGTAASYTYDANNRLLSNTQGKNATTYTYDDQGNMTSTVLKYNGTVQNTLNCTYDGFGRLKKASDSNGETVYTYDADGKRSSKQTENGIQYYVWDGDQLAVTISPSMDPLYDITLPSSGVVEDVAVPIQYGTLYYAKVDGIVYSAEAEFDSGQAELLRARPDDDDPIPIDPPDPPDPVNDTYTELNIGGFCFFINNYSGYGRVSGPAGKTIELYANDPSAVQPTTSYVRGLSLVAAVQDGVRTYYHYNAHGDVVQLTNSSGTVTKNYTYDAFGVEKNAVTSDTNPFRYCGEQYDSETGNYYLRARYYSPGIGRFTQEDPIMDGLNWYTYCAGNPVRFYDPSGCKMLEPSFPGLLDVFSTDPQKAAMKTAKSLHIRFNYLYNQKFEVSGLINGQGLSPFSDFLYGSATLSWSGCEVIANYNALFILGNPQSLNDVANWGENHGQMADGILGTFPTSSRELFEHLGYTVTTETDSSKFDSVAASSDVCIFTFWNNKDNWLEAVHTVAIEPGQDSIVVYNYYNKYAKPWYFDSISDMISKENLGPWVLYGISK